MKTKAVKCHFCDTVIINLMRSKKENCKQFDDFLMKNHSVEEINNWLKKNSELEKRGI